MTLPLSGDLSVAMLETELGLPPASQLGIGDTNARQLAGVPAGDIKASDFYGKPVSASYTVYFGLSTSTMIAEAGVLLLTTAQIVLPYQFTLTAGVGQYQYFASPVSRGNVAFYDRDSAFIGGWDGANNNFSIPGPRTINLNSVPHYLYRTDFPGLDLSRWEARYSI